MELIDKAAVVAEINDWRDKIEMAILTIHLRGRQRADASFEYEILGRVRDFIDLIKVKEVDLEEEVANWWNDRYKDDDYKFEKYNGHYLENSTVISLAEHFFELGLKAAQKGEKV